MITGIEVSLHALCDGKNAKLFPSSQDHKRALDGDQGLNTGGMGTYSPVPFLSDEKLNEIANAVLEPWLAGCAAEGIDFRGMLYPGIMLTDDGPKVLEFNARFGDPETQVYLPRLENDLVDLFEASIDGTLDQHELRWSDQSAVCVVIASGGYPGSYEKGQGHHRPSPMPMRFRGSKCSTPEPSSMMGMSSMPADACWGSPRLAKGCRPPAISPTRRRQKSSSKVPSPAATSPPRRSDPHSQGLGQVNGREKCGRRIVRFPAGSGWRRHRGRRCTGRF